MTLDDRGRDIHLAEDEARGRRDGRGRTGVELVKPGHVLGVLVGIVGDVHFEVGEGGVQLASGPLERRQDLVAAGVKGLDLLASQVSAPGQVAEDPFPHRPGLRHHLPSFEPGRFHLGLGGVLRLLTTAGRLDFGIASHPSSLEVGVAQHPGRRLFRPGSDLPGGLMGGGQHPRRLLPQLGGHGGLVQVLRLEPAERLRGLRAALARGGPVRAAPGPAPGTPGGGSPVTDAGSNPLRAMGNVARARRQGPGRRRNRPAWRRRRASASA